VSVSYKKLWKLLIDKEMTRTELRKAIGASSSTFARLSRNECISADLISRICTTLRCNVGDIMDVVHNDGADDNGDCDGM
jgi:DNA-binding Xre family transcriptional regulator